MGTRVYQYGLRWPTTNEDRVREQMKLAHRYRNTLTEIERGRRAATRSVLSQAGDLPALEVSLRAADAASADAARAIKAARALNRSRAETEPMREALRHARVGRSEAARVLREARTRMREDPEILLALAEIQERASDLRKNARAHCAVYWGSYLLVEDAAEQAHKTLPLYEGAEPSDPRFSRWDGSGRIGVQIQHGMTLAAAFGGRDTRFQISPVDERARHSESRSERRRLSRATLRMRIGSEDDRTPVWAEAPMIMHRPIPEGAIVKRVTATLRKHGAHEEWTCEITAEVPDAPEASLPQAGVVAVDLGWRQFDEEGIRVAMWVSDAGERGELRASEAVLGAIQKASDLRSTRDVSFNAALAKFVARRKVAAENRTLHAWPTWLTEATKTAHAWRSAGRLAALALRWKRERFEGDAEAYVELEAWRYHDHHLWQWETNQRTKALRRRREEYRIFAAGLARRFRMLVLEDFKITKLAEKPALATPREAIDVNDRARANRQMTAPSEARLALVNAFGSARVEYEDAADTTRTCRVCGLVETRPAAESVMLACECGNVWDQDENAGEVMLARRCERLGDGKNGGGARKGEKQPEDKAKVESRWERAKRLRVEKKEKIATAREALGNGAE